VQLDASAAAFNLSESDEDEPPTSARSQAHQPPTPHMPMPINTDDKVSPKSPCTPGFVLEEMELVLEDLLTSIGLSNAAIALI
jgi:hypothetical protein